MSKLPYATSKANPIAAQSRIRETLKKFGVTRVGFDEDFEARQILVRFQYKEYPVCLPVDYGKLSELYIEDDPWTSRRHCTRDYWEAEKREIAYRASFSLLEDYIKSMITIVELGIFSFEEIFFCNFVGKGGQRMGDIVIKKLPELVAGKALMAGD